MLLNHTVKINVLSKETKVNAFWIAAFYGRGNNMRILAEKGIDIFNCDKKGNNAMHLAARKGFVNVIKMLGASKYPVD